jgi:hypothetical protein
MYIGTTVVRAVVLGLIRPLAQMGRGGQEDGSVSNFIFLFKMLVRLFGLTS